MKECGGVKAWILVILDLKSHIGYLNPTPRGRGDAEAPEPTMTRIVCVCVRI